MRFEPYETPLVSGRLVRRYKRFLANIQLDDGTDILAHCPNSGSMLGMDAPGSEVMVRHVPDPKRKLKWTWELVRPPGCDWIGCNTGRPNQVVRWAIETGQAPGLAADGLRTEVAYGTGSRIDILLGKDALTYVEVKNTTLARDANAPVAGSPAAPGPWPNAAALRAGYPVANGKGPHVATFPDAITARGAKHMDELAAMVDAGHQAVVVFLVNRADCDRFDVARDVDSAYAAALRRAEDSGVRVVPLGVAPDPTGWTVRGILPRVTAADP